MHEPTDAAAVAAVLQQLWCCRLMQRHRLLVGGQVQARERRQRSAQVGTALQRYLYRFDSQR